MPSSSPAPRLVARSTVSFGMLLAAALSTASLNRGLVETSLPPSLAETVISRMRRVKILPRLASVAAFLCLMFAHLLWPGMMEIVDGDVGDYRGGSSEVGSVRGAPIST